MDIIVYACVRCIGHTPVEHICTRSILYVLVETLTLMWSEKAGFVLAMSIARCRGTVTLSRSRSASYV